MYRFNEAVMQLVAEVLNLAKVSASDDFFALGGTSLSAAVLVTRLEPMVGREIALRLLLENPGIGAFCQALGAPEGRAA